MIYAFAIAVLAGGLSTALAAIAAKTAKMGRAQAEGERDKAMADVVATNVAIRLSEAARVDEKARLEAVITSLKAEISALESDAFACQSPAIVRERLRALLAPGEVTPPPGGIR